VSSLRTLTVEINGTLIQSVKIKDNQRTADRVNVHEEPFRESGTEGHRRKADTLRAECGIEISHSKEILKWHSAY
jgi:hypothetical protein